MIRNASFLLVATLLVTGCPPGDGGGGDAGTDMSRDTTTVDPMQAKMNQAMAAGPAELTAAATIMDWPGADGQMTELRAGTNGWVCMPSTPQGEIAQEGENPMCLDRAWQGWADAWANKKPVPPFEGVGLGYMLMGDRGASNIDPYATAATADNQWVQEGPHIMLISSNPKAFDAYSTDPANGGPYVMWKGTPYVHLMVPVR